MSEIDEKAVEIAAEGIAAAKYQDAGCDYTRAQCALSALIAAGYVIAPPGASVVEWRPEVVAFASAMEERLKANDHKGGWQDCAVPWLIGRLRDEVAELGGATAPMHGLSSHGILHEAADVANFAMMIADVCGPLPTPPKQGGGE